MVRAAAGGHDPYGTARLRRGVLDAWAASPARFREDANAEEDLALGGYRDRLVVELAQNAADAAARTGVPGRLRLTVHPAEGDSPAVLAAANTGAPLDADGVESLATLRASAKRDEWREGEGTPSVGRFGVGFAAVLAVSDEPAVISRSGSVRWSLAEARDLAAEAAGASPGLADELRRRDGHVPLLRLPLPAEGSAPVGYDTAVVLPLRDGAAEDLAERLLAGVDDALLLTLPGLDEIVIEIPEEEARTLTRRQDGPYTVVEDSARGTTRWRTASSGGRLEPGLLADRPVEERLRPFWSVTWAVPVDAEGAPARPATASVVHAPTPTEEPLGLPALLVGSFPLEPTRRHTAPGPLTDFLTARAAETYAELLRAWQPLSTGTIDLVPGPLGKGGLDGRLRAEVLRLLPRVPFLAGAGTAAEGPEEPAADGELETFPGFGGGAGTGARTSAGAAGSGRGAGTAGTGTGAEAAGARVPCGSVPSTPRSSRAPGPRPCGCSPNCSPACSPPAWSAAPSCAAWAWCGCRSARPSTGSRASSAPRPGGGGSTTAWPAPIRSGSAASPYRSPTAGPPSARARSCCRCRARSTARTERARAEPARTEPPGSGGTGPRPQRRHPRPPRPQGRPPRCRPPAAGEAGRPPRLAPRRPDDPAGAGGRRRVPRQRGRLGRGHPRRRGTGGGRTRSRPRGGPRSRRRALARRPRPPRRGGRTRPGR
ncbi:sacsin N-terminal ATP-binding-like domain-containing protein [Streptomyces sp. MNU89]|uniref:sacsin N-terminal ATP-binding-like domain-containing protein n=1 Tax=Streptomyces sp. MNU89 TaxID=2560025 RepID=UPI0035A93A28